MGLNATRHSASAQECCALWTARPSQAWAHNKPGCVLKRARYSLEGPHLPCARFVGLRWNLPPSLPSFGGDRMKRGSLLRPCLGVCTLCCCRRGDGRRLQQCSASRCSASNPARRAPPLGPQSCELGPAERLLRSPSPAPWLPQSRSHFHSLVWPKAYVVIGCLYSSPGQGLAPLLPTPCFP